ncbi:MAG: hypothetical protein ACTSQY_06575 [Candidatus Odinarchaeia archaeon]
MLYKKKIIEKYIKIKPVNAGLTEKIIVIIEPMDERSLKGFIQGIQLLPMSYFYKIEGDINGIVALLNLPKGGVGKIFHILSEYLADTVKRYWFLPILNSWEIQKMPSPKLLNYENNWKNIPLIKNKKIVYYKSPTDSLENYFSE